MKFRLTALVLAATILSLSFAPAFADDSPGTAAPGFGASVGYWIDPSLSGTVERVDTVTGKTYPLSLKGDLGFGDQSIVTPELWYRFNHGQLFRITYNQLDETAEASDSGPFLFSGVSFPAHTPMTSHLSMEWSDITYEMPIFYDSFPPKQNFLDAVFGVEALRGAFSITRFDGTVAQHAPITEPVPSVGLHGEFRVARGTDLFFRTTGVYVTFEKALGWQTNLEGGVDERIAGGLSATAEYRYFNFYNIDSTNDIFAVRLYGPQLSLNYKF